VIVDGQMIGVGFQGQQYENECTGTDFSTLSKTVHCDHLAADPCTDLCLDDTDPEEYGQPCSEYPSCSTCSSGGTCDTHELPYEHPSLVFNNVFVQLDETAYPDEPASLVVESPKWSIVVPPVLILGGNFYYQFDTNYIFEMSGGNCGLEDFQLDHCSGGGSWSAQVSKLWDVDSADVSFNWDLEEGGLEDGTELDLDTYVPGCTWLGAQVDGSGDVIEPIDLANIDGGYSVSVDGVEEWTLSLTKPLPGLDPGDAYRGWTPCVD
jgi:hypothetical protein